jgi:alpha-amylase/alpha-mannosidase (GH57 family)
MERYVCIHGHFYQPPRENPWLEDIEVQDSAFPYHDWNERITAECYAPNSIARILDGEGWIVKLINNYARISFNFGPTLLSWMKKKIPEVYEAVREADEESRKIFSGHGSALAQAYNHMILPLANRRDKVTQVLWGIEDFRHHFGRAPEGMWLPETAVDLETLDVLAENGVLFTILAQHQAKRVRYPDGHWQDVSGGKIDPTTSYICRLPSNRSITIFFYDGAVARDVAFNRLLSAGDAFTGRILSCFSEGRPWPQMVHIATDGETYGHHQHRGDMALAYALHSIESRDDVTLTNYGEFLEKHPPSMEVEINERTSWSCEHGVDRWYRDCGCNTGSRTEWNQAWREPLRNALDWLRDALAAAYERSAEPHLHDPWATRDDYIRLILDRSPGSVEGYFMKHARRRLSQANRVRVLKLLEVQRHAMLMFTSCGWFFDELSGLETVQVLQYAGRALQLAAEVIDENLESEFLERLEAAKSNIPEHGNGRRIYERFVRPAMLDLVKVCAHYAVSSLFESYPEETTIYSYAVRSEDYHTALSGNVRLVAGRARVSSEITLESLRLTYAAIHFGEHTLNCGIRVFQGEGPYNNLVKEALEAFRQADFAETLRLVDRHFRASTYSLKSLFRDEQRKILTLILDATLQDAEAIYRQFYKPYGPLMRFLKEAGIPAPRAFTAAASLVINAMLNRLFQKEDLDAVQVRALLEQAKAEEITLQHDALEFTLRHTLERMAERLLQEPRNLDHIRRIEESMGLVTEMPFQVNLWKVENIAYAVLQSDYTACVEKAGQEDEVMREWVFSFRRLCDRLRIRIQT